MTAAPPILPESLPQAHQLILSQYERIQALQWHLDQLKKQLYGPSSEKAPLPESVSKEQILLSLFPAPAEPPATVEVLLPAVEQSQPSAHKRPRRQPALKVLETVTIRIEPEEKTCPHCGQAKCEIGCEKSERFEYVPAKIQRQEILRPKLACPCGEGTVVIAPLPPAPVDKGQPGPGLLAHVTLSKFQDHIPLYRQQEQFQRLGVHFPRQTLCDWMEKAAELLQPIARAIKAELLAGDYLQVDETPVKVLDPEVQGKAATGYLWVMGRPGGDVIFEFHPGRGKEYALELLGSFEGYLQRDGYGVYSSICRERPRLIPVGCLAHVRRRFVDALDDEPEQARWFVDQIRKLYLIEEHARKEGLAPPQRQALRQELSRPIWETLRPRAQELQPALLPQSPMGKALSYLLHEWEALQNWLEDGHLEIDNNLTENAIRPSAVGKKNWLFIGHPEAGWRSAVIYSILGSCKRRGIDLWEYLKDVFTRLPAATNQQIKEFTPARWKDLSKNKPV